MSFNPNNFIKIADDLVKDKNYDNESGYRTVIGRAYYGCYLYARDGLGLQKWQPTKGKGGEIHKVVSTTLKSKDGLKGDLLSTLRRKRNLADYISDKTEVRFFRSIYRNPSELITALWTIKESVLKGLGVGFNLPPKTIKIINYLILCQYLRRPIS